MAQVLKTLPDVAEGTRVEINQYSSTQSRNSNDKADSDSSIFDALYQSGGSRAILNMYSFTATEFNRARDHIAG